MQRTASTQSATILAFPVGGRREARAWSAGLVPDKAPAVRPAVDCDAWYHQAAIRDADTQGNA